MENHKDNFEKLHVNVIGLVQSKIAKTKFLNAKKKIHTYTKSKFLHVKKTK